MRLPVDIDSVKGFLDAEEGKVLFETAKAMGVIGPVLEVGSYCGKSTVYLGVACKQTDNTLFSVDHHRGSEEHQPGEEYHDADLYDPSIGRMDSFREFRATIRRADIEEIVVPMVAPSTVVARHWRTPLGMVFIDGGHSFDAAMNDYRSWASHVLRGGIIAIHDVFENPKEGGQAPYEILKLARASGLFKEYGRVKSLALVQRV